MDNGLLTEGRINPNLGQINELISPAQNYYNSLFVQVQHRMSQGLSLQFSYTLRQEHHAGWDGLQQSVRLQQYPCSFAARPAASPQLCRRLPARLEN
jgi:hypothetical protein